MNERGILYVVATPLGNLEDITLRALRILREEVSLIAAEDTRHSRKLLSHYQISTPLISYFEANEAIRIPLLLEKLQQGVSIALVSDAGTPGISDPGYRLVKAAREQHIPVIPIPGPTALIAALSVSGLPTDRFVFEGFLPARGGKRKRRLEALREEERTIILYESPYRILSLLETLQSWGDRRVVIAREMTKVFEEFLSGSIPEVLATLQQRKIQGEFTVIVEGAHL